MSLIQSYKISKKLDVMEVMVGENKRKQPCIYVCDTDGHRILLKQFFGKAQYRKWLLEAVVLKLLLANSYEEDICRCLSGFDNFFKDKKKNEENIVEGF